MTDPKPEPTEQRGPIYEDGEIVGEIIFEGDEAEEVTSDGQ